MRVQPNVIQERRTLRDLLGKHISQQRHHSRRCANALVLVVTSSDSARDRETMAKLGANGYFRKPSDYEHFMKLGGLVRELLDDKPAC